MSEEPILPIPNLNVPQALFVLSTPSLKHLHDKARDELVEGIKADEMGPYYRSITSPSSPSSSSSPSVFTLPRDEALLSSLEATNKAELAKIDERLAEAEKTEGETEISEALKAKAAYLVKIGDREAAVPALTLALSKTPGLGSRIDLTLTLVRLGFFFSDNALIVKYLAEAEKLIDQGGDWDRRNRLKVYTSLHLLSTRSFAQASGLLLDALSTFTATELVSFNDFVALAVIAGTLCLSRADVKKKIIASPEVAQVTPDLPVLGELYKSLYDCHYDKFFTALAKLEQTLLLPSRLLHPHARFYVREMRILAYGQLLESYRSLTIDSLARAFGVTPGFIDEELSRFIASGRIRARIDKVNGIVETTRPSSKSAAYEQVVKKGDVLLNEMQRLSKVLH